MPPKYAFIQLFQAIEIIHPPEYQADEGGFMLNNVSYYSHFYECLIL